VISTPSTELLQQLVAVFINEGGVASELLDLYVLRKTRYAEKSCRVGAQLLKASCERIRQALDMILSRYLSGLPGSVPVKIASCHGILRSTSAALRASLDHLHHLQTTAERIFRDRGALAHVSGPCNHAPANGVQLKAVGFGPFWPLAQLLWKWRRTTHHA
jgi:hypothetical protein